MAFLQTSFFSEALGLHVAANVLLPVAKVPAREREIPVLYLLHGYSDDHTAWMRQTSIERYAATLAPDFAVIMPAVDHSFYTDRKMGNRYWTFVSSELPAVMGSMFPLSARREDNYVAGLSMGGYGTLKLALNFPERFRAGAALSAAANMGEALRREGNDPFNDELRQTFGSYEDYQGSCNDLFHLASVVAKGPVQPDLYIACGDKDFLYQDNLKFLAHVQALGLPVRWESTPGREHTWDYWDEQIQVALKWFVKLRKKAKEI